MRLPTKDDTQAARDNLAQVIDPTPLQLSREPTFQFM